MVEALEATALHLGHGRLTHSPRKAAKDRAGSKAVGNAASAF